MRIVKAGLALTSIAAALLLPGQAAGRLPAALRVVAATPLTVRGTNFRPRETVRLSVVMGTKTLSKQLRVGALGGFTVRWVGVRLDYCKLPLLIAARGTSSGLVRARLPIVDCAMP